MGDRGNIKIGKVYLYTHWGGSGIKQVVQNALKRRQRWNDEAYLTRIIFCELLKGDDDVLNGETGYGISTHICDNEHNIIRVNTKKQTVYETNEDGIIIKIWSFEEFIKIKKFKGE
jgi:hypothetical protein